MVELALIYFTTDNLGMILSVALLMYIMSVFTYVKTYKHLFKTHTRWGSFCLSMILFLPMTLVVIFPCIHGVNCARYRLTGKSLNLKFQE